MPDFSKSGNETTGNEVSTPVYVKPLMTAPADFLKSRAWALVPAARCEGSNYKRESYFRNAGSRYSIDTSTISLAGQTLTSESLARETILQWQHHKHASLVIKNTLISIMMWPWCHIVCWSADNSCSEFVLIPWSAPKRNVDFHRSILIPVANTSTSNMYNYDYPLSGRWV